MLLRNQIEGGHVLRETGTAVAQPGAEELGPIRLSRPMPVAISSISASTASARLATALINEIFMARKALEACLMISALCAEVTSNLAGWEALHNPGNASAWA